MPNLKLDIGSGGPSALGQDWISIDLYAPDAMYNWPMDAIQLPPESVSQIYCCHALEHIPRHKVIPTLQEWWRVLEWGGIIEVLVPDLTEALEEMVFAIRNPNNLDLFEWRCHFLFGKQDHPGNFHQCGFVPWLLDHYFEKANFKVMRRGKIRKHDIGTWVWEGKKVKPE